MLKDTLTIPCPFKVGGYCDESCENFYDILVVTAEEASRRDVSFNQVVEEIVNSSEAELSVYRMKLKHPETAEACKNNIIH
jgi:hypothetical protein